MSELRSRQAVDGLLDALLPTFLSVGIGHVVHRIQKKAAEWFVRMRTQEGALPIPDREWRALLGVSGRRLHALLHDVRPEEDVPLLMEMLGDVESSLLLHGPQATEALHRMLLSRYGQQTPPLQTLEALLQVLCALGTLRSDLIPGTDWLVYSPTTAGGDAPSGLLAFRRRLETLRRGAAVLGPATLQLANGSPGLLYLPTEGQLLPEHYRSCATRLRDQTQAELDRAQRESARANVSRGRPEVFFRGLLIMAPMFQEGSTGI